MSRSLFALLALAGSVSTSLFAGVIVNDKGTAAPEDDPVPLNIFNSEYNFTNSSSLHGSGSGNGQGDQNASYEDVSYSRRIHLKDNFYFRIGVDYQRYDFGSTNAPVPNHLQGLSMPIAIEYIVQGVAGAGIEIDPGFWYQDDIKSDAFDIPWRLWVTVPLRDKKLYAVAGAAGAQFYRYKAIPIGGLIWIISDTVRLEGVFPKPALVYVPNDNWEYRLEGDVNGGGFRVDDNPIAKYNHTVLEYVDFHAGPLVTYKGFKPFDVSVGGGWSFEREFDYFRDPKTFKTGGAPYAKVEVSAGF